MKQRVILVLLILSLFASGYSTYRWRQADARRIEVVQWTHFVMDSLGTSLNLPRPPMAAEGRDTVYWQWIATTAQMQSRRWQQAVRHWAELRSAMLDDADIAELKRKGLERPPMQLRESLLSHPELIPYKGIQGGTMFILPDDAIMLLRPPYVFAEFEDGHIGGAMLVEYSILPGPKIQWKRLWAARK